MRNFSASILILAQKSQDLAVIPSAPGQSISVGAAPAFPFSLGMTKEQQSSDRPQIPGP